MIPGKREGVMAKLPGRPRRPRASRKAKLGSSVVPVSESEKEVVDEQRDRPEISTDDTGREGSVGGETAGVSPAESNLRESDTSPAPGEVKGDSNTGTHETVSEPVTLTPLQDSIFSENSGAARAHRRLKVSQLYLRGRTQAQIQVELGLSSNTVSGDLRAVRREWIKQAALAFDERKAQEIARVDRIEEQAWLGWERSIESQTVFHKRSKSQRQAVRVEESKGEGRTRSKVIGHKMIPIEVSEETVIKGQSGDPRFLEQVAHCVELRLRILGLWKGDTVNNNNTMVIDWQGLFAAQEERRQINEHKMETVRGLPIHGEVIDMLPGAMTSEAKDPNDPVERVIREYERRASIIRAEDFSER